MQDFILAKREEIAELCRQHHVRRLSIFGSATRDDFNPAHSDVDIIVEFEEEIGAKAYFDNKTSLIESLRHLFGRNVDLLTWKSVRNPYFLDEVVATQEQLYAA
jgi:predicted nucleotidyltransferase